MHNSAPFGVCRVRHCQEAEHRGLTGVLRVCMAAPEAFLTGHARSCGAEQARVRKGAQKNAEWCTWAVRSEASGRGAHQGRKLIYHGYDEDDQSRCFPPLVIATSSREVAASASAGPNYGRFQTAILLVQVIKRLLLPNPKAVLTYHPPQKPAFPVLSPRVSK